MDEDFDLESLVQLEQKFFDAGFKEGFDHGRIHGLIEGRALGREKGFELSEEVGFYEGFARLWQALLQSGTKNESPRKVMHIRQLLALIEQFPLVNPSAGGDAPEVDISRLLAQIRSKYRTLCASLGVRPSLRAMNDDDGSQLPEDSEPQRAGKKSVWPTSGAQASSMSF